MGRQLRRIQPQQFEPQLQARLFLSKTRTAKDHARRGGIAIAKILQIGPHLLQLQIELCDAAEDVDAGVGINWHSLYSSSFAVELR